MRKKSIILAVLVASVCTLPSYAQGAYDSVADTGEPVESSDNMDTGAWSQPTGPQNAGLNLPKCNTATLSNKGRALPDTRLSPLCNGMEAVVGGEGTTLPRYFEYTPDHYLDRVFDNSPGLTTDHRINSPSAQGVPE